SPMALPAGMDRRADGVLIIDPDVVYPRLFAEIEKQLSASDKPYQIRLDRYWLEVIYQVAKLEAQRCVALNGWDPRRDGNTLRIKIRGDGGRKDRWALANFPENRGIFAATKEHEARKIYTAMRGFLPVW